MSVGDGEIEHVGDREGKSGERTREEEWKRVRCLGRGRKGESVGFWERVREKESMGASGGEWERERVEEGGREKVRE